VSTGTIDILCPNFKPLSAFLGLGKVYFKKKLSMGQKLCYYFTLPI